MKESALYVHIPFCDHKCIYCDFYSVITKDKIEEYLYSLKSEIVNYSKEYSSERIFNSIFFGGGTPSLMEPAYIQDIIQCLKNNYHVSEEAEITLEANPGTIDPEKLVKFRKIGINRMSIGIQSFHDDELKFLTRIHDKELALKGICDSQKAGFENISIDLIFNLPGQSLNKWMCNLEQAVNLPIKHISAYSLILEGGTVLNKMVLDGKVKLQDADYDAEIYEATIEFLRLNGFYQYEVSNYAQPGYECRHNNAYWHYKDYLSFGTSSHSFANGNRWWNVSNLTLYLQRIKEKGNAVLNYEILTQDQMLNEYVMLALRSNGLNLTELSERFGKEWLVKNIKVINSLKRRGFISKYDDRIQLTPKGYAICDNILTKLL